MKTKRGILVLASAVLLDASAVLLIKQSHAKRQLWRSAAAEHHAAVARCLQLGREVDDRIQAALKAGISRREFTTQFGEVSARSPRQAHKSPPDATHVYTHEPSHRVFYLRFQNDILVGVNSSHGPDDIQPHLPSIEQRIAEIQLQGKQP